MINTLYLSYDGLTDPLGQSQVLPYIIGLKQNVKCSFIIISFEKENNFKINKKIIENILKANSISWIPLKYTKRPPIFSTIWDIYKLNNNN